MYSALRGNDLNPLRRNVVGAVAIGSARVSTVLNCFCYEMSNITGRTETNLQWLEFRLHTISDINYLIQIDSFPLYFLDLSPDKPWLRRFLQLWFWKVVDYGGLGWVAWRWWFGFDLFLEPTGMTSIWRNRCLDIFLLAANWHWLFVSTSPSLRNFYATGRALLECRLIWGGSCDRLIILIIINFDVGDIGLRFFGKKWFYSQIVGFKWIERGIRHALWLVFWRFAGRSAGVLWFFLVPDEDLDPFKVSLNLPPVNGFMF